MSIIDDLLDDIEDDIETNPFKSSGSGHTKVDNHKREVAAAISEGWVVVGTSDAGTQLKKGKPMRIATVFLAIIAGISVFFNVIAALFFAILSLCNQAMTKEQTKFITRT